MLPFIRIFLHVFAGWLLTNGYVNEELRDLISSDAGLADAVQVMLAVAVHIATLAWWRLAKRFGWKT